jgi:hypothetical protein
MQLSNSFTLSQLTFSETAVRRDIDNTPNAEQIVNLTELAQALERVQELVGPISIHSAFRSPKLNSVIGGSTNSAHMEGYACDFTAPSFGSPLEVCEVIKSSGIPFDQLIQEGTWVHVSVDPRMRKEALTANFAGGKASYTLGLS